MPLIDPHAHTRHSDGTDTPAQLVAAAQRAGLDYVGISDPDTTAGWEAARAAASALGMGLVPGVEVSAAWQGRSVHVLGLLIDPQNEPLQAAFARVGASRQDRIQRMVANMSEDFPGLEWSAVVARAAGAPMGRPHLADELVALGHFNSRAEAFAVALHPAGPYWVRQDVLDPAEAVALIRGAGGVPVLAHPRATRRTRPVPDEVIEEMVGAGLFGLERDHRDQESGDRAEVERLATQFGLAMTGGSDYHGTGKPNGLGENVTSAKVFAQIVEQGSDQVVHL